MSYTLEGREMGDASPDDVSRAPCIFCGEVIWHFNEGGVGWILGAVIDGVSKFFLYCDQPMCAEGQKNKGEIWRCYCYDGLAYVESVGETCQCCRRTRDNATQSVE